MTKKVQFRILFPTQKDADSFLADLNTLPEAAQPPQWIHTAQITEESHTEKGPAWQIQLFAPKQVSRPLRQFARKNSALNVKSKELPGGEDFPGY